MSQPQSYDGEIRGLKEANVLLRRDPFKVRDEIRDNAASIVAERVKELEAKACVFEVATFGRIAALEDELKKAAAAAATTSSANTREVPALDRVKVLEDQLKAHEVYMQISQAQAPMDGQVVKDSFAKLA